MEHLLLKAVAQTHDQGLFDAVISSASVDREKDVVDPAGMVRALHKWADIGKKIPLAWQHSQKAEDQVGWIDPASARVVGSQVVASGWVDQSIEQGKHVWRLAKSGTLGFSFGYLTVKSRPREDGGRWLDELDVFEITASQTPMNPDTRVLHTKALDDPILNLRDRADAVARENEEGAYTSVPAQKAAPAVQEKSTAPVPPVPDPTEQRRKAAEHDHRQASDDRAREQHRIPDVPLEPRMEPRSGPVSRSAPDAIGQRQKAAAYERDQQVSDRARAQDQIPDVPPLDAAPALDVEESPSAPDTEAQWRKAVDAEREQSRESRQREQARIPDVGPEPPSKPEPEPPKRKAIPETQRQRRWARAVERKQAKERRLREEREMPSTVEPEPIPRPDPVVVPETRTQRRKAVEMERRQADERRLREEHQLPTVPSASAPEPIREPEPVVVPNVRSQRRKAVEFEREHAAEHRQREQHQIPTITVASDPESIPESIFIPDADAQRRKATAYERETAMAERRAELADLETKVSAEPFSASHTSNWVARGGGLPHYIQHIAHDLMEKRGMPESQAIQMAIGIVKRWASGAGKVTAKTRAEAAAAVAEWEKLKASSKGKALDGPFDPSNVAQAPDTTHLEALITSMPMDELCALFETLYSDASATLAQQSSGKTIDSAEQRQKARNYEREAARAMEDDRIPEVPEGPRYEMLRVPIDEMSGLADGELKAVWSAAEINNLPDSAFLYVESGGKRDADGKTTPRSLRHFPYKDSSGAVDLPHLRNALARIPQSNLPQATKDTLTAKAQKLLADQSSKSADVTGETLAVHSVDLLRQKAEAVALEHASGGESLRKPPQQQKVAPRPEPEFSLDELRQRSRDEMLMALSGLEEIP